MDGCCLVTAKEVVHSAAILLDVRAGWVKEEEVLFFSFLACCWFGGGDRFLGMHYWKIERTDCEYEPCVGKELDLSQVLQCNFAISK